ncbi:MAG: hypothetical protein QOG23_208 [Blastocatellia bacterium]|jgi:hypothetical protein|nr:hypothetical protein [Blastocatellia bacterium]
MAANIEEKVIEKLRVLPEDRQAEVLKFVEDLAGLEMKTDNGQHPEPTSFLQVARSLRLQGPADWSSRLDDYLYGGAKLDEQ